MLSHVAKETTESGFSGIGLRGDPVAPQREGDSPEQPEVGGGVAVSETALVFLKTGTVQTLMGAVFDVPVLAFEIQPFFGTQAGSDRQQEFDPWNT